MAVSVENSGAIQIAGVPADVDVWLAQRPYEWRTKGVRLIAAWLGGLRPDAPPNDMLDHLEEGARLIHHGPPVPAFDEAPSEESPRTRRLRLLLRILAEVPTIRTTLTETLGRLLAEMSAVRYLEGGLPSDRGILEESANRLARRFLPRPIDENEVGELLARLLRNKDDATWIAAVPSDLVEQLVDLAPPMARVALQTSLHDTISLGAGRVSALGLTDEIRARAPRSKVRESPFHELPRRHDELLAAAATGSPSLATLRVDCEQTIVRCREVIAQVLQHLDEFGVSVDVVYRLEVMTCGLARLNVLLEMVAPRPDEGTRGRRLAALAAMLTRARIADRSLRDLVSTNVRLLARKIIERAGQTGEHYITATRREYWTMLGSAGGGGLLTAGTTMMKYLVAWGSLPLFVSGLAFSVVYAGSFLVMQLLGFTLATKQPSMTAAALAGSIKEGGNLDETVKLVTRICRSQVAAAIGNIAMVIPAALLLDFLYRLANGHSFFSAGAAEHTIHSLHPTDSLTILYAALTGVLLWVSSLGAGWLENWVTFRRVPEAIAEHRIGRIVGRHRMEKLAHSFAHGISGIGGNITLGFLLGMVPVFAVFVGLPLDVRHVTLSTGALTFAASSLGQDTFIRGDFLPAVLGIAFIGILNFGVSFALALGVALRARSVERGGLRLLGAVLRRFVRAPMEFVWPPRDLPGGRPPTGAPH